MTTLDSALFDTAQIRALESLAVTKHGLTEQILMERAGEAAFLVLQREFPYARRILICCGGGNNAGDGYVLAKLLHDATYEVYLLNTKAHDCLPKAAHEAFLKVSHLPSVNTLDVPCDLIVDALLGIGLSGNVRDEMRVLISQISEKNVPVLSLDIPSGLNADTGVVMGCAVKATATITFIGNKIGLMTGKGAAFTGHLFCDDLGLSSLLSFVTPFIKIIQEENIFPLLEPRSPVCHKGDFGHVLVAGGALGMPGAPILAAKAALRVGAGKVTIATEPVHAEKALSSFPEVMFRGVQRPSDLNELLSSASVCVLGPGLSENAFGQMVFKTIIGSDLPLVVDASALRLLKKSPAFRENWVLTPHPGEAAYLLNTSVKEVESDRRQALRSLYEQYGGGVVLKGHGSLIQTAPSFQYLCREGNPGMATAGMGDVLSGIIGGLFAQGLPLKEALLKGVFLHAKAGDLAANKRERGMIASDLFPFLRLLVNRVS